MSHEHEEWRHYSDGDSIAVTTCEGGPECPDQKARAQNMFKEFLEALVTDAKGQGLSKADIGNVIRAVTWEPDPGFAGSDGSYHDVALEGVCLATVSALAAGAQVGEIRANVDAVLSVADDEGTES